jgi:hypothetical protein
MVRFTDGDDYDDTEKALIELSEKSKVIPDGEYCNDPDNHKLGVRFVSKGGQVVTICPECLANMMFGV